MSTTAKRTRGRPSWVTGTKLVFLEQYAEQWQKATDTNLVAAGHFYTKVTRRFIKKYGWHFNRWTDKDCPDPDPATIDEDDTQDRLTKEEAVKRNEYYQDLRAVSCNSLVWTCLNAYHLLAGYNGLVSHSLRESRYQKNLRDRTDVR
jgi:hypothetical protein